MKCFSRDELAEKFQDTEWLNKVVAAISRHWRNKNVKRRKLKNETQLVEGAG